MKITWYGYNTFFLETENARVLIDPGAAPFYHFRMPSLFPRSLWPDVTHIIITHGDVDHYRYVDQVAKISGAPLILNRNMLSDQGVKGKLLLSPRKNKVVFDMDPKELPGGVEYLSPGEKRTIGAVSVSCFPVTHGTSRTRFGPFPIVQAPGGKARVGWGSLGYRIEIDGKVFVNPGDTEWRKEEWESLKETVFTDVDLFMVPIGGGKLGNTLNIKEALQAIDLIQPRKVTPCHYNCPLLWGELFNKADAEYFAEEVKARGKECLLLKRGIKANVDL